jgi:hypothetical protein
MAQSNTIPAGLGAGFFAALACGVAAYLGFDALFTLIPLGNPTERTVMAILVALLSGCAGLFIGFWWVARRTGPTFAGLRIAFLLLAAVFAAPAIIVTINYALTNQPPFNHSLAHVELRLPAGATVPPNGPNGESYQLDKIGLDVLHGNVWRSLEFDRTWLRRDGERAVLMARAWLPQGERPLAIKLIMPGQPFKTFDLDLKPDPEPTAGFGDWHRVTSMTQRDMSQSRPAAPSDDTEVRVRITRQR